MFARSVTAEFSSFNRAGSPVTIPTIPYVGENGTLDISTGLTYPTKAERSRRNPQSSLLFADPVGDRDGSCTGRSRSGPRCGSRR